MGGGNLPALWFGRAPKGCRLTHPWRVIEVQGQEQGQGGHGGGQRTDRVFGRHDTGCTYYRAPIYLVATVLGMFLMIFAKEISVRPHPTLIC